MTTELYAILESIIDVLTLTLGIGYAAYIYHRPMERTWISVVIGVGGSLLAVAAGRLIFLLWQDVPLDVAAWACIAPELKWLLTGAPMVIGQEIKHRRQRRKNRQLNGRFSYE